MTNDSLFVPMTLHSRSWLSGIAALAPWAAPWSTRLSSCVFSPCTRLGWCSTSGVSTRPESRIAHLFNRPYQWRIRAGGQGSYLWMRWGRQWTILSIFFSLAVMKCQKIQWFSLDRVVVWRWQNISLSYSRRRKNLSIYTGPILPLLSWRIQRK